MAASPRVVVVTGVNRGIGLGICERLATGYAGPLIVYAASRAGEPVRLTTARDPSVEFIPAKISLTENNSIDELAARVRREQGGCDVLINNAGIYLYRTGITPAERKNTIDINFRGTVRMCEAFLPMIRENGRLVNVSSQSGQLKYMAPHLRQRFLKPDLTIDEVHKLIAEYEDDAAKGVAEERGWPPMTYFPSKAGLNTATRIYARDYPNLLINCCCPGWVDTELGGQAGKPPKSILQGADIPLRLAFADIENVTGRYWANEDTTSTAEGEIIPF